MASFDSTKIRLFDVLKDVKEGSIQLPDFQRGWIWDDFRIKGLLASIAKSFPIGVVMMLETGNDTVRFKTKCIEGVKLHQPVTPKQLILDGQQRLTSLFQAIISNEVVKTRNATGYEIQRWYYIDMKKAMENNGDLEDAIISINEKKQITSNIGKDIELDLSEKYMEYQNLMFPVHMLDEPFVWSMPFQEYWKYAPEKTQFFNAFFQKIVYQFNDYALPVIMLSNQNSKEAVCQVFEKVNTGGVSLTVFELLTATYASDDFDLKEDWESILKKFKDFKVLKYLKNTEFIQAITLLASYYRKKEYQEQALPKENTPAISCKRKDMLNLTLENYKKYRDQIIHGYIDTCKLLHQHHIYTDKDLPYSSQLIPMAAIMAVLGNKMDLMGNKNKLMRWYWCGVFGELYGGANETRFGLDLPQVVEYVIHDSEESMTIFDANFAPSRLHTLRTRNSAAYKGIYALLLEEGTRDWLSASSIDQLTYFSESIDVHHIFPVVWCEKNRIHKNDYNSIVNKTPLSGRTNRIVSGSPPSKYLERLRASANVSVEEFEEILKTHAVNVELLRADDFVGFFNDRKERILSKIEKAMGKKINRDASTEIEGVYTGEDEEDE
jgi:hypothetical protein